MISKMDRLPEKNDHFITECGGYSFEILSVENRMVQKVGVKKIENPDINKEEVEN
jgi:putative hemolysin